MTQMNLFKKQKQSHRHILLPKGKVAGGGGG